MPDYDYHSDARPFSRVIEDLGARDEPKLYLGELVNAFGERGFGALLLFLGLINALPLPPGSTTVLGAPLRRHKPKAERGRGTYLAASTASLARFSIGRVLI